MADKKADLAGPGISTYEEVEKILPADYTALLDVRDTQVAVYAVKSFIERELNKALNLMMVQVPLIVAVDSGVNDMLDRDGSRTPVEFDAGLGLDEPIRAAVVQAATKWKRMALKQFNCSPSEGINTDMRAVRKDYFMDHDHSCYVDQWDWERVIVDDERNLEFLTEIVRKIWSVFVGAEEMIQDKFPQLEDPRYPNLPRELTFIHAEDILDEFPDLPRKRRESEILQKYGPVFIYGIGYPLKDGYPHEMRAADYDDWITKTVSREGKPRRGLNGDILVWNHVTGRRHELSSMGIRVNKETLVDQLKMSKLEHYLELPYHQAILNDDVPLSIGGGIGQSRVQMLLLRKAHLGEVSVTIWPDRLKDICRDKNIFVLE